MRLSMLLCSVLVSVSSLAATTLRLEANIEFGDYVLEATMTPDPQNPLMGEILAHTSNSGLCSGRYGFNFLEDELTIIFDDLIGSEDSSGGCQNESLKVDISATKFRRIERGEDIWVIFHSQMFFMAPNLGKVTVVSKR